jgi:hypothetical protein
MHHILGARLIGRLAKRVLAAYRWTRCQSSHVGLAEIPTSVGAHICTGELITLAVVSQGSTVQKDLNT